ncbi:MAG: divergent polysaccharide deacetylase family protein [Deltaproteobacteria bacterium]|nr:MAG: divergent polysaccharide deacetylase family protein [Deltaproteobacteria bacterium]
MAKPTKKKSAARRSKTRLSKRSARTKLLGWITGVVFLLLAVLSLWSLDRHRDENSSIPAYEEADGNGFSTLLGEVEAVIYQGLRQLGVQTFQVRFRKAAYWNKRDRQREFTELQVTLDSDQSLIELERLLEEKLRSVGRKVTWEARKQKPGPDLELLVKLDGIVTHRLAISQRRDEPSEDSTRPVTARLAIVIDDLGYDGRLARRFLEIEGPLSFSVLPHGTFSESIARRIHQAGRDLLLHLPMEPKGYPEIDPGVGALLVDMTSAELRQTLRRNLDTLHDINGVNNHMGSRFCENETKMSLVMQELKHRELFFLDSRTTSNTKGHTVAVQLGVPSAERDVFLDNIQSPRAIRAQMKRLIQLARLKGRAIGIAHPHEATLRVLKQVIPQLPNQGIELVPVSELLQVKIPPD